MEMKHDVWVYVELINGKPGQVSLELLGKGRELADSRGVSVVGLLIGQGAAEAAQSVIGYGADSVVVVEDAALQQFNALLFAKAADAVIVKYEPNVVLIGASHDGRDLGGRLSALLGLGLVADCIDCSYADDSDSITWIRPAYTGKLLVKILTTTRPQLATISDRIFRGNAFDGARQGEIIKEPVDLSGLQPLQQVKSFEAVAPGQVDVSLDDAEIIVSAGRGVGDEEGLKKVEAFAAAIGAACGVSKPLVDNGWAPHERQVGVTGKKVAPKIYIALGISGAIQHKLGIQEAELVIAVNTDPDAPIFKFANYGIVGDLFKAMPVLEAELKQLKK